MSQDFFERESGLWAAATIGDVRHTEELLRDPSVNVNFMGAVRGDSCLHRACRFGHSEVVRLLLGHAGIMVNLGNLGDATPLSIACQEGSESVVELLLADPRVDVNQPNVDGCSPFFSACGHGHLGVVKLLLSDPGVDVNRVNRHNSTALWIAGQFGHIEVVLLLLASGRELVTTTRAIGPDTMWHNRTAAEHARLQGMKSRLPNETAEDNDRKRANGPSIADWIERYETNAAETRAALRTLPSIRGMMEAPHLRFESFISLTSTSSSS